VIRRFRSAVSSGSERLAAEVIREQTTAARIWIEELGELPFDVNTIRNLRRLVSARMRHIEPEPS
jgi:hypothetical protein